jgi:2-polyprenyl-3-methyl-5-hydroxy-6-metoxy-1,4-benzoquinol methylase
MNSKQDVVQLYNSLFELEEKFKHEKNYPIHKKLNFKNAFNDIYELIISRIDIKNKTILDAGCGVGFGSILLLKNGAKHVTGISISDKEIERANQGKTELNLEEIEFKNSTFDQVEHSKYDLIICVESLKHSLNMEQSLTCLLNGLKPHGQLGIVDDFFDGIDNQTSNAFALNWHLNFLISTKDVTCNTNGFKTTFEDLTTFVVKKSSIKTTLSILFFRLFKKDSAFKKLFLGGLLLDQLYLNNQMKYQLVIISKTA